MELNLARTAQAQQAPSKVLRVAAATAHLRGNEGLWQHNPQNRIFQLEARGASVPLLVYQVRHRHREIECKALGSAPQENYAAPPFRVVAGGDETLPGDHAI